MPVTEALAQAPANPRPIATVPEEFKPPRTDRTLKLLGDFGPFFGWLRMYWRSGGPGSRAYWFSPDLDDLLSMSNPPTEWAYPEDPR